MASFVMIHGAWHGGWCFDPLRDLLEAAGHTLIAPDLPGMGGTAEELEATRLEDWAEFAAGICREQEGPVLLCGHSRGGIVISQAAEAAPDAIDALVYICAMLLPTGLSRAEWKAQQVPNPAFDAILMPVRGGTVIDAANAGPVFAQLSPPAMVAQACARLLAEPDIPRATPLRLSEARYGSVPRHYIECLHDRTIPLADQRRMQEMSPCATVTALDADHSPFLSAPAALAGALLTIAAGVTP
jgi:pimeloyl-ACP methyl ester carboxylesterase